jgi:hypothetical protein
MAQRLLNFGVQDISELRGVEAVRRSQDKGFDGGQKGAEAREPDGFVGPQPAIIKAGDVGQSVEAPAVRVAGE